MNLSVVDNDRSPYSTRLVQKVGASEYFHLVDVSNSYQEAMQCIEKGDADLILEIPPKEPVTVAHFPHCQVTVEY